MASIAARGDLLIDVEGLSSTVTDLIESVGRLTTDVSGLMASDDGGVYGEDYAEDRGPAVRARFFEGYARANDDNGRRITDLIDLVAGLEATMAEMATIQTTYHDSVDQMAANIVKLEGELKDIRGEVGVSASRMPSD